MAIVAAAALGLVAIAVAAIILTSREGSTGSSDSAYRQKLQTALAPLVSANQALSSALQSMDGSQQTITAAQNAANSTQSSVLGARGAVAVLTAPKGDQTLSQEVQQALADESGYVQAVSSTLATPTGAYASQFRLSTPAAIEP